MKSRSRSTTSALQIEVADHGIIYHARLVGMKGDLAGAPVHQFLLRGPGHALTRLASRVHLLTAADGLYVNLFEPSTIRWSHADAEMQVTLLGNFPMDPDVKLEYRSSQPANAKIRIRVPSWAAGPMSVRVNQETSLSGLPENYLTLDRMWSTGNTVRFTLPIELKLTRYTGVDRIEGHERFALEYGPILTALTGSDSATLTVPGGRRHEDVLSAGSSKIRTVPCISRSMVIRSSPTFHIGRCSPNRLLVTRSSTLCRSSA